MYLIYGIFENVTYFLSLLLKLLNELIFRFEEIDFVAFFQLSLLLLHHVIIIIIIIYLFIYLMIWICFNNSCVSYMLDTNLCEIVCGHTLTTFMPLSFC